MKRIGAVVLVLGTLALALLPDPGPEQIVQRRSAEFAARLEAGEVQVEPAELLTLMHDRSVRLRIVDLRDEGAWNWFHLVDAERVAESDLPGWGPDLDWDEIVILVDADGSTSPRAWQLLQARDIHNSYLLRGGIDAWLHEFGKGQVPASALGHRHPAALPDPHHDLDYVARVKRVGKAPVVSGGCG